MPVKVPIIFAFCLFAANLLFAQTVYVGGEENGIATYWVNNSIHTIPAKKTAYNNSVINSIFVVGNDVYAVGKDAAGSTCCKVAYWKNDVSVPISDSKGSAKSIFVSNTTVSIAYNEGVSTSTAYSWVEGQSINLVGHLKSSVGVSTANSVYSLNNITYVAGYKRSNHFLEQHALYWIDGKEITLTTEKKDAEATAISVVNENAVYIAGWEKNSRGIKVAKYWINNGIKSKNLTDGFFDAAVTSIFVSNGIVYISGWEKNKEGYKVAKYWKGGVATALSDGKTDAEATAITVLNGTVYIAGNWGTKGGYWKDNRESFTSLSKSGKCNSIFVVDKPADKAELRSTPAENKKTTIENPNTDSKNPEKETIHKARFDGYLSGYEIKNGKTIAKYWKNGIATLLTNGQRNAMALSVYAVGNDIYAAGWEENNEGIKIAKYWKNAQQAVELSAGIYDAVATAIFVDNNRVYVSGNSNNAQNIKKAVYWNNGELNRLSDVSGEASANAIFVLDGVVYAAGFERKAGVEVAVAKYWQNGKSISLSDGTKNTTASCIYKKGNDVIVLGEEENANGWSEKYWKGNTIYKVDIREAAFHNTVPANIPRDDGFVTSVFYSNRGTNSYSNDIKNFLIKDNVRPVDSEKKLNEYVNVRMLERCSESLKEFMRRWSIKHTEKQYVEGILQHSYEALPKFFLEYKSLLSGVITHLEFDWREWGLCKWDETEGDFVFIRKFISADDFKENVCKEGKAFVVMVSVGLKSRPKMIYPLNCN